MIGMRSMAGRDQRPCGHTGAIVIESGDLTALSMARSLGRRGIPVWLLTGEGWFAGFSRYVIRSLPWPAEGEARQLAYLLDLGARYRLDGWALYPNGDEGAALLARNHAVLTERFRVTVPPWEVLRWAYD